MSSVRRRYVLIFLGIAVLGAVAPRAARATAPNLMAYQGRLKQTGVPATGNHTVDILLCSDPVIPSGSCLDTGIQNVAVSNGLFRTTFTAPSGINWQTGTWYLEIQVDGSAFTPRERLAAVPYAVYASSAATLVPNPGDSSVNIAQDVSITGTIFRVNGSSFIVNGSKVGIGTANPGTALEVVGDVTVGGSAHIRINGSAGAPSAGVGCGTGATVSGGDSVGRVTIGTGSSSFCTVAFANAWSPNPPVCYFTNESRVQFLTVSGAPTVSNVTFTTGSPILVTGDIVSYLCLSY